MSLKGYEWLIDGKVAMTFTFKRLELDIWQDVSIKEYHDFINYIRSKGMEPHSTDQHYHNIIGLNKEEV